jgi:hemolysin activation/secretion protein
VQVQRWEVQGNTLLADAVLQARLAGFTGVATLERLRAAAAAVQALYREAGFGGVVAFLPEQDLAGGRVLVRVVEGKLARVEVTGQRQYSLENVRASLPSLQEGRTPNVRRIDAEIQIANENPAKTVQVLLQPGSAPGEVAAAVTVEEQPVARWSARLDNTGGAQVGRWRAALGWQHANMLGRDHVLALEVQTAPEDTSAVASVSGSWRMPLYGRALAADVYGAWSNVDVSRLGTGLGGDLAFTGKGVIVGGRLSAYLPRLGNIDQRASVGLELRDYRNSCSLGQQAGVCDSVSVHPLTLGYTAQAASDWRWGVGLTLSHNLALGGSHGGKADFAAVREGAQRRYTVLRANAQLGLPLAEQWQLQARASAQWTDTPLVAGEMFGAGGAQSVRGYEERELSGDTGLTLGLDVVGPNLAALWLGEDKAQGVELRPVGFVDAGSVHVLGTQSCRAGQRSCSASGAGLGLRLQWQSLALRLDVALAGRDAGSTQAGDWRTHLLLSYSF